MNIALLRRAGVACLAFVAIAVLVVMVPTTVLAAYSPGVLDACVNPGNGMMRLVDSITACHANETFVEWNITGPQGPAGPQGPQGPAGASAGGPPFVWACTPAFFPGSPSNNIQTNLYIFNGSSTTANVAVHILDKAGTNLAGVTIPGTVPPITYPGQTGSSTVAVSSLSTLIVNWDIPTDTVSPPGGPNVSVSVQVISDQPIVVGTTLAGQTSGHCSLLPK
jgi:hypothetical protein